MADLLDRLLDEHGPIPDASRSRPGIVMVGSVYVDPYRSGKVVVDGWWFDRPLGDNDVGWHPAELLLLEREFGAGTRL